MTGGTGLRVWFRDEVVNHVGAVVVAGMADPGAHSDEYVRGFTHCAAAVLRSFGAERQSQALLAAAGEVGVVEGGGGQE